MHTLFKISFVVILFLSTPGIANTDPNIHYLIDGKNISPWEFSLQFGQVKYDGKKAATIKGSLTATAAAKAVDGDAIRLKWKPKNVKNKWGTVDKNVLTMNLTNTMKHTDLTSVLDQAALTFDIKVNKPPKKNVVLMLECGWNWQCRTTLPLKNTLKRLPQKEWVNVPIPLKCLINEAFDFSKVTTIFSLETAGKMDIEISNVQLTALPAGEIRCG